MTMRKTQLMMAAAASLALFGMADMAQAKPQTHKGQIASPAQLQREHDRAVKANDAANDPFDSSSSDSLNQQQLTKAQGMPSPDASNVASNSMTNSTPDINSAAATTDNSSVPANSMASTTNTTATGDTANPTDDSTVPPATPSMTPYQTSPQAAPSEDKGKAGTSANPTDATDSPPSSNP